MARRLALTLFLTVAVLTACGKSHKVKSSDLPGAKSSTILVTSPAFADGDAIPADFTCDGRNVSPALRWSGVPTGVAELGLLMNDRSVAGGGFVHWVVWRIDARATGLDEGRVPAGAREAKNSFGKQGYGGPCPPHGSTHTYVFTLYALRQRVGANAGASADEASRAITAAGIIAQGQLTATYPRK